jgi:hypothetical protein
MRVRLRSVLLTLASATLACSKDKGDHEHGPAGGRAVRSRP